MFDAFWSIYPNKISKGYAQKMWNKLNPNAELAQQMILAVKAQKLHRERTERANDILPVRKQIFIPPWKNPSTWINQQCWLDEVPTIVPHSTMETFCADCGGDYKVKFKGKPYCTRCYDNHAHPEIKRAS